MLKLKKIALTGNLSCGKSSACRFFKDYGAYVVSADEIVHRLLSPNTILGQSILDLLGRDVLSPDGQFDRKKIAKIVFGKPLLLKALEAIVHPIVRQEINKAYNQAKEEQASIFIAEIPLLFEGGMEAEYDASIVIDTPENKCIERFINNKESNLKDYNLRMQNQLPRNEKLKKATFILKNEGSLDDLKSSVYLLFQKLTNYQE